MGVIGGGEGCIHGGVIRGCGLWLSWLPSAFKGAFSLFRFSAGAVAVSVEPHSHRVKKILLIFHCTFPLFSSTGLDPFHCSQFNSEDWGGNTVPASWWRSYR